ncbi:MAG: DUF167 domain-containing protein [Rickettsiales bacterium]|jgi:uncharacterized protein (TIGR00251 family)|nr:DUF167 domain-containing protein [Rickettsiales bacterium]
MAKFIQHIHLIPRAKREGIIGEYGERIKIAVSAPAVDGKANEALIELLAAKYAVPKSQIHVIGGFKNRNKIVEIEKF